MNHLIKKTITTVAALVLAGCAPFGQVLPSNPPPASTASPTSASATAPAMPKVVGMRLSEAKQLLAAQGYLVKEEDSSGQGRQVLEPANWVVESQLPEEDAEAPSGTQVLLKVKKPSDGAGDASGSPGTVPDVVCKNLQEAQDTLQAAGYFLLGSEDATGQRRQQVVDRNWVVVSQSEQPGTSPDKTTRINLGAVKFGEPTGASNCGS